MPTTLAWRRTIRNVTGTRTTVAQLFEEACVRIERLEPVDAHLEAQNGALIVDIRDADARRRDGIVPCSLHIPRTVLEWRVDPESEWRNPYVGALDTKLILLCDHGYSSALAASALVALGFSSAADVVGGFEAWRTAGLPVGAARDRSGEVLPGLGPPD